MKYFVVFAVALALVFNTGCMGSEGIDRQNVQQGDAVNNGVDVQDSGLSNSEGSGMSVEGSVESSHSGDDDEAGVGDELTGNEADGVTGGGSEAEGNGSDKGSNESAKKINPIVALDFLLGGYSNDGKWVTAEDMAEYIEGGEIYSCYAFDRMVGTGTGSKVELLDPINTVSVTVACESDYLLAVGGEWNALPRVPVSQGTGSETYKKIVKDILTEEGLPDAEAVIKQNYRIDLEGDGIDEVLIWASNLDYEHIDIAAKKGQYSIIILRKIIDGEVKNIPVSYVIYTSDTIFDVGDVDEYDYEYNNYSITYVDKIRSIADVNGDGKMEVIVDSRYYEGEFVIVYELQGDKMVDVLSNGWGV